MMAEQDKASKKKRKIMRSVMKNEQKRKRFKEYLESHCKKPEKTDSTSWSWKPPEIVVSTDEDDDSDVCIVDKDLKYSNVANSSLREIYLRKAESNFSSEREEKLTSKSETVNSRHLQCLSPSDAPKSDSTSKALAKTDEKYSPTIFHKMYTKNVMQNPWVTPGSHGMLADAVLPRPFDLPPCDAPQFSAESISTVRSEEKFVPAVKEHVTIPVTPKMHSHIDKQNVAYFPKQMYLSPVFPIQQLQPHDSLISSIMALESVVESRERFEPSLGRKTSKDNTPVLHVNDARQEVNEVELIASSSADQDKVIITTGGRSKNHQRHLSTESANVSEQHLTSSPKVDLPAVDKLKNLIANDPATYEVFSKLTQKFLQDFEQPAPVSVNGENVQVTQLPNEEQKSSYEKTDDCGNVRIIKLPAKLKVNPREKAEDSKDVQVIKSSDVGSNKTIRRRRSKYGAEITQPKSSDKDEVKEINLERSSLMFSDVGGLDKTLKEITLSLLHLKQPDIYEKIGLKNPPRGILLHGPSGCGKTLIAHAIAGELQLPFIKVAATELVSGVSGDSEKKIRELFERASLSAPCILFIDEIDAIASKREPSQRDMEKRMVIQIMKCMDDLNLSSISTQVMVIGATNKPDVLDPSLRRAGRFDREIAIGIPDESSRLQILELTCKNLHLQPDFDFHWLARVTPGYVGADLVAVVREAAISAVNRVFKSLVARKKSLESSENVVLAHDTSLSDMLSWLKDKPPLENSEWDEVYITVEDFESAIQDFVPSAKREGFATIPNVTWNDIGALNSVKETLQKAILWPLKYKKQFEEFNLTVPAGILLCGPKGCGKTLLAKAVANECSINFLSVKGPELLNMYVGESERAVRECFQRARDSAPCVIFFDEIDALCPQRSMGHDTRASDRVVNQLLTEIDGIEERKQIFVMGATNRPDNVDSAMLRPGRLEKQVFVGVPDEVDRLEILKTVTKDGKKPKLGSDVLLEEISRDARCEGFSGADLCCLVREASFKALEDYISKQNSTDSGDTCNFEICKSHFDYAFTCVKPSISEKDRQFFKRLQ